MQELPEFECDDLTALGQALIARSKAMKRIFNDVNVVRISDSGSDHMEVAEITFRKKISPKSKTIRIKLWSDRWVWVDARELAKSGWKWSFNAEGRISGNKKWADVIDAVEETDRLLHADAHSKAVDYASNIWTNILMKGPIGTISRSRSR